MQYRTIETKAEQVNDRIFRFVISDETLDRYNTVIKADGWRLDNYLKNPIVAYQHITWTADPDLVIGKSKVWIEDNRLLAEAEFEPSGDNEIADKVVKKLMFGSHCATSVGFDPIHWSFGDKEIGEDPDVLYLRKNELLEWSVVKIPANANATIQKEYASFILQAYQEIGHELPEDLGKRLQKVTVSQPVPSIKDLHDIMTGKRKPSPDEVIVLKDPQDILATPQTTTVPPEAGPDPFKTKYYNQIIKSLAQ